MKPSKDFTLFVALLLLTTISMPVSAQELERLSFRVQYVTPEAVFIKGGSADGLQRGDKLRLTKDDRQTLQLEVQHVATHSANCVPLKVDDEPVELAQSIRAGDTLEWTIAKNKLAKRLRSFQEATQVAAPAKRYANRRRSTQTVRGQVNLQAFGQKDQSPAGFDFYEPSLSLRFALEQPGGLPLHFRFRSRSSETRRTIGDRAAWQEPLHRVYELDLQFEGPNQPVEFSAGRMLNSEIRGLGYLDGLSLGYRLDQRLKVGVFAGVQPEPYHAEFSLAEKKMGAFVHFKSPLGQKQEVTLSATGIGRYMNAKVSREYVAAEIDFVHNRKLYLTQYLKADYNRGWRRKTAGSVVDVSSAYFNASYYPARWIFLGMSYDGRRLVRTWENHSLADSLFDQALRQGWRASVSFQPTSLTRVAIDGGVQDQSGGAISRSLGFSAQASNLMRTGLAIGGRMNYYTNDFSTGYYPGVDISRSISRLAYFTLGAGAYVYKRSGQSGSDFNPWERLRLDVNLGRRCFLSTTLEHYHGDSMRFLRGFLDLGWRL